MTDVQLARFMIKVNTNGPLPANRPELGPCWLWTASCRVNLTSAGKRMEYGQFGLMGKTPSAHRVAYEHWVGSIPDDKEIDHLCRTTKCVNPKHLEAVTHHVNIQRSDMKKSPEARARIGASKIGKKRQPFGPEWRANISASNKGKHRLSQETIDSIADKNRGQKRSEETRSKLRAAWVRRKARAA